MSSGGEIIGITQHGRSARRWRGRVVAVAVVVASLVGGAGPVTAQDRGGARTEYEELLHEEQERRDAQRDAEMKAFDLAVQVAELDGRIAEVEVELTAAQAALAEREAAAAAADARVDEARRVLDREEQRLRDQSIAAYIGGGSTPLANFTLAFDDPAAITDMAKSRVYAAVVVEDRRQVVARFGQAREDLDVERAKADQARQLTERARDEVAAVRDDLQAQRRDRSAAQEDAEAAAKVSAWLASETEGRRREAETRYAAEVITSDSIRDLLANRQRGQIPAATTFGIFLNPIRNGTVVSPYGMRLHPILGYDKMHFGLDIDGHLGDPMRASEDGVVVIASEQGGYGNTVVIDHGNTLATLYGHMSRLDVGVGDVVTRGQVIGLVGSTGQSTGPHCHWEVRVSGLPVDGMPYLDRHPEP